MLPADAIALVRSRIRNVPDFPKPGILFKDIAPLLGDPRAFAASIDLLAAAFESNRPDAIVAIESRGFLFGAPLALRFGASFSPVRKRGKLPFESHRVAYALEYGEAELEMHVDGLRPGARVLVVDDLLATGGTAMAAAELVEKLGAVVSGYAFVVELDFLGGRARLEQAANGSAPVHAIVSYGALE